MDNLNYIARDVKSTLRRLSYRVHIMELLDMARRHAAKADARLTFAERYRFRRWLCWKYGPDCAYCGKVYPLRDMTIDHIQPVVKGGAIRDINNMALACLGCNRAKGNTWP